MSYRNHSRSPDRHMPYADRRDEFRAMELTPADEAARSTERGARAAAKIFLLAALWPLVTASSALNDWLIVWPWALAGIASESATPVALAGVGFPALVWIPMLAAVAVGCACMFLAKRPQAVACMAIGAIVIGVGSLLRFGSDSKLVGAQFLTGLGEAGAQLAIATIGAVAIAAGNRLRKQFSQAHEPLLLTGIGGAMLVGLICCTPVEDGMLIASVFERAAWTADAWPANAFVLMLFAFGAAGLLNAFRHEWWEQYASLTSVLARALVAAVPIVLVLLRENDWHGFAQEMIDGGRVPALMAMIKCLALFYAALLLLAHGATGYFAAQIWSRIGATPEASSGAPPPPPVEFSRFPSRTRSSAKK